MDKPSFNIRCAQAEKIATRFAISETAIAKKMGVNQSAISRLLKECRGSLSLLERAEKTIGGLAGRAFVEAIQTISDSQTTHSGLLGPSFANAAHSSYRPVREQESM